MESLKEKPDFEKAKHTPLPWTFKRTHHLSSDTWYVLIDPNGRGPIMDIGGKNAIAEAAHLNTDPEEVNANAAFIVEACNNYYSLQKELILAKEEIERLKQELKNK